MFKRKVKEGWWSRKNLLQPYRRYVFRPGLDFAIFTLISLFILTGCHNLQSTQMATAKSQVVETPEKSTTSTEVKKTTESKGPEKTIQPTLRKPDSPTITDEPDSEYVICSPLAEHNIQDLPGIVSSPYEAPPMGKDDRHQGVDFAYYNQGTRKSIEGEGVQAIFSGWVAVVIEDRLPYGNTLILETPATQLPEEVTKSLNIGVDESIYHLYAHFSENPLWSQGNWVECGQVIGYAGKSGYNVPVSHLHLETRIGPSGTRFDGMVFYDTQASEIEMENYKTWRMSGVYRHFNPMTLFAFSKFDSESRKDDH